MNMVEISEVAPEKRKAWSDAGWFLKQAKKVTILGVDYFSYAWWRWGIREAIRRWWEFEGLPRLTGEHVRRAYARRKRKERRKRSSYSCAKTAVNRDGDYYLVECPECHGQSVYWLHKDRRAYCNRGHQFTFYTEDGIVALRDHREGDIRHFPTVAVFVPGDGWRLGLSRDAPWWWQKKTIYLDLHDGKDAHGHQPYKVLFVSGPSEDEAATKFGLCAGKR